MYRSELIKTAFIGFILCLGYSINSKAQQVKNEFLPKYPVKSAIIQYTLKDEQHAINENNTVGRLIFRETFDNFGALVAKEQIGEGADFLPGGKNKQIFKDGYIFWVNSPEGCTTKSKLTKDTYSSGFLGGLSKQVQDLIYNKVNKLNSKSFQGFAKTGTVTFLGLNCTSYEYNVFNFALSSKDKIEFIVYHDICLSSKYYLGGNLLTTIEAISFEENISIPASVFEIPQNSRIIDGDKLEAPNKIVDSGFSTLIINFDTKKDYGQVKEEGKKTLYIKDSGKVSAQEWEGTIAEYGLPPEKRHTKEIRVEEFDYFVDFGQKSTRRRNLVNGNYNDKTAAELNYIFRNNLYDNTVKLLGKTSFLGKECTIFEIRVGIEKLEVYEWQGVFLKTKRFMCADGANCTQPLLMHEETATQIRVNVPISNSIFEYPEQFELIIN